MFDAAPLNDAYVQTISPTAWFYCPTVKGMADARSLETMLDVTVLAASDADVADVQVYGVTAGSFLWTVDIPAVGTANAWDGELDVTRNAATIGAAGIGCELGKRTRLYLRDNGSTVIGSQDGDVTQSGPQSWSAAQASYPIVAFDSIFLGKMPATTYYVRLRLHEAWIKVNGILVAHWVPTTANGGVIKDHTPFGNDLSVVLGAGAATATEGTDFVVGSSWSEESILYYGEER